MATKSAADYGRPDTLTIRTPDDFHHHFRDEPVLADTVQACSAQFRRAIAMPNLVPPVTTVEAAAAYRERILGAAASRGVAAGAFEPLMTLYLTDSTTPEQIKAAHASGIVKAVKLYPAGATTNSASGVTDYAKVAAPLAAMGQYAARNSGAIMRAILAHFWRNSARNSPTPHTSLLSGTACRSASTAR